MVASAVDAGPLGPSAPSGRSRTRAAALRSRVPGLVALLTAAACAVAGLTPTLAGAAVLPGAAVDSGPVQSMGGGALLVPAALVLAVPGLAVLLGPPRLVARVRPTLSVVWLAVPFAGGPALDVLIAGGAPVAAGGAAVVAAYALALLTALAATLAGSAERRDVGGVSGSGHSDDPADRRPREPDHLMLPVAAVAAVLAVPGFGGPLVRGALGVVDGTWQPGAASWGALAGLLGVAVAALFAPRTRPPRGLALLGGAASVLVVRLSALVLTPPRPGEHVGAGTWAAVGALVAVVVAAGVAVGRIRAAHRERVALDPSTPTQVLPRR